MAFIPEDIIQQVLDRADIVGVISAYLPLKPAGRNFKAACPFHHEKTPSFIVNPDKQIFHCFGCGVGGNVISFVMRQERLDFPEAVRLLAEKYSITIVEEKRASQEKTEIRREIKRIMGLAVEHFSANLFAPKGEDAQAVRQYLKGRAVSVEAAKNFKLGFARDQWDGLLEFLKAQKISPALMEKAGLIIPRSSGEGFYDRFRNRIIFPIFDVKGDCLAFGGRAMEADAPAKYMNSPETPVYNKGSHLYGLHVAREAIAREDVAIVVEGYMDFLMPFQHGVQNIVASLGTALTVDQIRLLRRFTHNVVMLFDADTAGQMAMLRSLDLLIEEGMSGKVASLSPGDDPDSFVRTQGAEAFRDRVAQAESLVDFKLRMLFYQHGRDTVEARAKVAAAILPTIDKFDNVVAKSEYLKKLAYELSVSEEALAAELKRLRSSGPSEKNSTVFSPQAQVREGIRPAERDILKLMLQEKDFVPLTKAAIQVDDFVSQEVREIVAQLFSLFDQGEALTPARLIDCFDDQKIRQLISGLLASGDDFLGDKKKIHHDCINRLRQERQKFLRQDLRRRMEAARHQGDHDKVQELAYEFNQLIKGL